MFQVTPDVSAKLGVTIFIIRGPKIVARHLAHVVQQVPPLGAIKGTYSDYIPGVWGLDNLRGSGH